MLSQQRFGFPQLSNHWGLTLQGVVLGIGLLIGAFPQFVNGLECYDCIHATAGSFPSADVEKVLPGKVNEDCIDPAKASNLPKKTCTDPNESCFKGYAGGIAVNFGKLKIGLLVRQCFVPSSGQPVADTCIDYDGMVFGLNKTISWGAGSRSLPRILTESLEVLHKALVSDHEAKQGKQSFPFPDVEVNGTYCLCKANDLCNDAPGMEVINTNPTTTTTAPPSKGQSPIHKVGLELIIFGLIISFISWPSSVLLSIVSFTSDFDFNENRI